MQPDRPIDYFEAAAYCIPTQQPESDGTLVWNTTTIIVVHIGSGETCGIGYTYGDESLVSLLMRKCKPILTGKNTDSIHSLLNSLHTTMRNLGSSGMTAMAIAAVDNALWDLRARLYDTPLVRLLGMAKARIASYGSGGFTSYTDEQLHRQLSVWAQSGFKFVKMKIGRDRKQDPKRVSLARKAVGDAVQVFVDANGAYTPKEACAIALMLDDNGVTWLEEPVYHADRSGLSFVRNHTPPSIKISAGEYGFNSNHFKDLLLSGSVDIMQADATRCGITGFLKAAALCEAFHIPISAHTAPSLHVHLCCAVQQSVHAEYFFDHVRIEQMLFEGAARAREGWLIPDLSVPGNGLQFKKQDAERFRCS